MRRRLRDAHPAAAEIDRVAPALWGMFGESGPIDPRPFTYLIADFYRTDPISRASVTMAECSDVFPAHHGELLARTGTDG